MKGDRFGFGFWLRWILWFAGTLVLASFFWTFLLQKGFGQIRGNELTVTWALAVFGSWFLLVVPFIRKKEQIWKRLNDDQERAVDAWLRGVGGFLALVIASGLLWSVVYAKEFDPAGSWHPGWIKAVLVSWAVLLMPFLIWMYKKADQIMKIAAARQTTVQPRFQTAFIERSKRILPKKIKEKIASVPPLLENGHVVTMVMKNGERIPNVFVLKSKEILGVYDRPAFNMDANDIVDVEMAEASQLPLFEESKWLRLDGRA